MNLFKNHYELIFKRNFVSKFLLKYLKNISTLTKIILYFSCRKFELKHVTKLFLFIELITYQKNKLLKCGLTKIVLHIKKGYPTHWFVYLIKNKMYRFLYNAKILIHLGNIKKISVSRKNINFSLRLSKKIFIKKLYKQYVFLPLPILNIIFVTNSCNRNESFYLLKSLKIFSVSEAIIT